MTKEEIAADRAVCDARTFPIQTQRGAKPHPLLIPWSVAELAYSVYAGRYGRNQSLKRLAERGGFGPNEMDMFLPDWRERCDEIVRLRALIDCCPTCCGDKDREIEQLEKENAAALDHVDELLRDYAAALDRAEQLQAENERLKGLVAQARGALADIAFADDLDDRSRRNKARRHYEALAAADDQIAAQSELLSRKAEK